MEIFTKMIVSEYTLTEDSVARLDVILEQRANRKRSKQVYTVEDLKTLW